MSALLLAPLHAFGCASGGPSARPAHHAGVESGDVDGDAVSQETAGESNTVPPDEPCADESCVPCGAGLCPQGFYCDESVEGGAACGWVPDCPDSDCACLTRVFRDCSCDAHAAGARLRCG